VFWGRPVPSLRTTPPRASSTIVPRHTLPGPALPPLRFRSGISKRGRRPARGVRPGGNKPRARGRPRPFWGALCPRWRTGGPGTKYPGRTPRGRDRSRDANLVGMRTITMSGLLEGAAFRNWNEHLTLVSLRLEQCQLESALITSPSVGL
jgi:hypothetical protein